MFKNCKKGGGLFEFYNNTNLSCYEINLLSNVAILQFIYCYMNENVFLGNFSIIENVCSSSFISYNLKVFK